MLTSVAVASSADTIGKPIPPAILSEETALPPPVAGARERRGFGFADVVLIAGLLSVIVPTLVFVARETWSNDQGAHAPIVLMTGIWLILHKWPAVRDSARAPRFRLSAVLCLLLFGFYALVRVTHIVELEGYVMYAVVVATAYALFGWGVIRRLAFPIVYLAFVFPPPETLIYAFTLPMKVAISQAAIAFLGLLGYPIGGTGVIIQIGQYQLLVAAACSGLNSIVSLSALTIFYIYVRYADNARLAVPLLVAVLPIAIAANFVRVLILILLTYHSGEAAAQGFLHDLAGITMFATALVLVFALDTVLSRIIDRKHADPRQVAA